MHFSLVEDERMGKPPVSPKSPHNEFQSGTQSHQGPVSGVAYEKLGAIFPLLVAPNPAPTVMTSKSVAIGSQSAKFFEGLFDRHFPQASL
jgi:hypothetical protein